MSPTQAKAGETVHFSFQAGDTVQGKSLQSVTISGPGLSGRMSKTGDGVYGYDWTVPASEGYEINIDAFANYEAGVSLSAYCVLEFIGEMKVALAAMSV